MKGTIAQISAKYQAILKLIEVFFILFHKTKISPQCNEKFLFQSSIYDFFLFQLWVWNNSSLVFWLEITFDSPAALQLLLLYLYTFAAALLWRPFFLIKAFPQTHLFAVSHPDIQNNVSLVDCFLNNQEFLVKLPVCLSCHQWEREQKISLHTYQPSQMELAPGYITSLCNLAFSNNLNLDEVHIFHELLANFKKQQLHSPIKT